MCVFKTKLMFPAGCVEALLVAEKLYHLEVHSYIFPYFHFLNLYHLVIWERILYGELEGKEFE